MSIQLTNFRSIELNTSTRNPSVWYWKREHRDILIKSPYEDNKLINVPIWELLDINSREWLELEKTDFPITHQDVEDYIKTNILGTRTKY